MIVNGMVKGRVEGFGGEDGEGRVESGGYW